MASVKTPTRILHVDGDSFFASCEIALHPEWQGRPVWVGGGRRGDGIVIAANRDAKKFGVKTGMACFEAKRLCPQGVAGAAELQRIPAAVAGDVPHPGGIFADAGADFH